MLCVLRYGVTQFLQSYVYMLAQSDQECFLPNRYPLLQCFSYSMLCVLRYGESPDIKHEFLRGYELTLSNKCVLYCFRKKLRDV